MKSTNLQKKDLELQSNKDIFMYYHTTIRNVALTTALSFAGLSYSRFYRGKSRIYSSGLVFVSILILLASFIININLYNKINFYYKNNISFISGKNFLIVNILFIIAHIIILLFNIHTLLRMVKGKKF